MKILLIIGLIILSGCASAGLNGMCGRITTQESTLPYVGGKGNIDGYACHIGCVGVTCGKPDYGVLQSIMTKYLDMQTTSGKLTTTTPGVITFTPNK